MTPKELLYVEDALGHLSFLKTQCNDAISSLKDESLKKSVQTIVNSNDKMFDSFYKLV